MEHLQTPKVPNRPQSTHVNRTQMPIQDYSHNQNFFLGANNIENITSKKSSISEVILDNLRQDLKQRELMYSQKLHNIRQVLTEEGVAQNTQSQSRLERIKKLKAMQEQTLPAVPVSEHPENELCKTENQASLDIDHSSSKATLEQFRNLNQMNKSNSRERKKQSNKASSKVKSSGKSKSPKSGGSKGSRPRRNLQSAGDAKSRNIGQISDKRRARSGEQGR